MTANAEKRVGTWSFPTDYPFLIPAETCGNSVVAHANADLKPIHTRFFFSAPVGSGTMRFRVLIKQAEQGKVNNTHTQTQLQTKQQRQKQKQQQRRPAAHFPLLERALTFLCACCFRWRVV